MIVYQWTNIITVTHGYNGIRGHECHIQRYIKSVIFTFYNLVQR